MNQGAEKILVALCRQDLNCFRQGEQIGEALLEVEGAQRRFVWDILRNILSLLPYFEYSRHVLLTLERYFKERKVEKLSFETELLRGFLEKLYKRQRNDPFVPPTVGVFSWGRGAGQTTIALSLAASKQAEPQHKSCLLEMDFFHPTLNFWFGEENEGNTLDFYFEEGSRAAMSSEKEQEIFQGLKRRNFAWGNIFPSDSGRLLSMVRMTANNFITHSFCCTMGRLFEAHQREYSRFVIDAPSIHDGIGMSLVVFLMTRRGQVVFVAGPELFEISAFCRNGGEIFPEAARQDLTLLVNRAPASWPEDREGMIGMLANKDPNRLPREIWETLLPKRYIVLPSLPKEKDGHYLRRDNLWEEIVDR